MISKKLLYSAIFLSILFFVLNGCSAVSLMGTNYFVAKFDYSLTAVERPADAKERYGEQIIEEYNPEDSSKFNYLFEDGLVRILWLPAQTGFYFQIFNKTDNSIKVIWDEAVFVDQFNKSHRVMHSGIKYNERDNPQPPTVIIRKGSIDDFVAPTDYVYFYRGYSSQYIFDPSEWRHLPLINIKSEESAKTGNDAQSTIGKKLQVLLPLEIQGNVNDYIFEFSVTDFKVVEEKQLN